MSSRIPESRSKLGLALGGGGARGLAHVGILKVLKREGIQIGYLSGTSMGAIIAAAYARGMDPEEIQEQVLRFSTRRALVNMVSLAPPRRGLMEPARVKSILEVFVPEGTQFSKLLIPLAICATDLLQSKPVMFSEGEVLPAVMASMAVPGIFPPVEIPPYYLVDGGILNNVPVDMLKALGAKHTIAVDVQVNHHGSAVPEPAAGGFHFGLQLPSTLKDLFTAASVMITHITEAQMRLSPPDLFLRTPVPAEISMFSGFSRAREVIQAGEQAAEELLPRIIELSQG